MIIKNPEKTFCWIVEILNKNNISFVVTGGLAAKSYGSRRTLNDIDIDIPDNALETVASEVKPYIIFGPSHFKDKKWDLMLMTLNHNGQEIDLSGGDTLKIRHPETGEWRKSPTNFLDFEKREIFGVTVPVITKMDLVEYKSMLDGNHQKVDIEAVLTHNKNPAELCLEKGFCKQNLE